MNIKNKELILFDLDGTLIDSVPDLANAVNHTLKQLDRQEFPHDTIRTWVGNGAQTLVKRALSGSTTINKNIDENIFQKALDIFLDFYTLNLAVQTTLYSDVKETLICLKQKGYHLAIITNKPYDFIQPILQEFGLLDIIGFYLGGDSLDVKKPDPYPLVYTCDKYNISIEKSIMIGDSKNDILAANKANMDSIALTYGYNYDEDISIYNPTVVIDNFSQINEIL